MATFRLRVSGKIVPVPDSVTTLGGAQDFLRQQGLPPEELGLPPDQGPELTGTQPFDVAAGKFFADRIPGMDNSAPAPGGVGGFLGSVAPSAAVGMLFPAAGPLGWLAQGGVQAGLEAVRKGSTPGSIASAGAWGTGGAAMGEMASRVVSGIYNIGKAALTRQIVQRTSDALRLASEGTGGNRIIEAVNRKALNESAAGAIYQQADKLTPDVLANASDDIGQLFKAASPTSYDPTQARQIIDAIPDSALPGKRQFMEMLNRNDAFTETHRALRDMVKKMDRSPNLAPWADQVDNALVALEQNSVGANQPLLTRAREGWKNLRTLESMAEVVDTGNVPAGRAARAFSSETKGYGVDYKRNATAGTQPETQRFLEMVKGLAANKGAGTSNTAERLTATAAGLGILGGVASGELSVEDAAKLVAAGAIVSPSLAAASVGVASKSTGALGAAAAQEARKRVPK